jgi:hypothetical protein
MRTLSIEPYALSPKAAATFSGLGLTRIKALIRVGVLPIRKDGRRTLILRADIEAYIANLSTGRLAQPRGAGGKFVSGAVRDA